VVLPWTAQRLMSDVDQVFQRAAAQSDLQVQSDYAKYLVIRISGLVEQAVAEVVQAHVSARASPSVVAYTTWRMGAFQNPNMERLLQLVGSFDRRWREALEQEITDSERGALGRLLHDRCGCHATTGPALSLPATRWIIAM